VRDLLVITIANWRSTDDLYTPGSAFRFRFHHWVCPWGMVQLMLSVLHRHWLRIRTKPQLVVQVRFKDPAEDIHVGEILIDEMGQEFTLAGLCYVRYATEADAEKHRGEVTVTLVPVRDGTEPLTTLQKKPTSSV
jgi:hypothetical protein